MTMPPMLAYTVRSSTNPSLKPFVIIDVGRNRTWIGPDEHTAQDDSYWIVIIDAKNPRVKVKDWVVPGASNSTVPPGLDTYMNDPNYIFAVATQNLSTLHVPQGPFYDFLAKYGAGRELQRLEQINAVLGCGSYGHLSYVLTGQGGPRGPNQPSVSYESGSSNPEAAMLLMSLMAQPNGGPPYSIMDSYTFKSP